MFRTDPPRRKKHGAKRLVLFLAAFVLTVLLLAHVDSNAASRAVSTQAKFAGAFVNWGPIGREHTLQAWEKWLKQKPSSVLGVDFYGQTTWEDFSKLSWVPGVWKKLNPVRNLVWSMPLTVKGTPLADVAEGLHDTEFEAAARAISEAHPQAIIRLGWEMNLSEMAWFAGGHEADYIKAFRRVVEIFRRHSSGFKFDWCPGWGPQEMPADSPIPATTSSTTSVSTSTTSSMKARSKSAGTISTSRRHSAWNGTASLRVCTASG